MDASWPQLLRRCTAWVQRTLVGTNGSASSRVSSTDSRHASCGERPDRARGQTTLDFAIGISLFLAVLLFILLFLPGILSPFTESAQEETIASNRVADKLTSGMLASPAEPNVLNGYCTVEFFAAPDEGTDSDVPGQCNYGTGTLEEQVGVADGRERVRVTVRGDLTNSGSSDVLCWDHAGTDTGLIEAGQSGTDIDCSVTLARGDEPTTQDSITAVRRVSLDDTDVSVQVEVW